MEKRLSESFYVKLEAALNTRVENEQNKKILKNIDWEFEAEHCILSLQKFFSKKTPDFFCDCDVQEIGVIDICWNEYGGNIEIDFMPSNNFETAFDDGCIMNNHAIDNDRFFKKYFNTDSESAGDDIPDDYFIIPLVFYYIFEDIAKDVANLEEVKQLPLLSPSHIAFAICSDDERTKIHTMN